MKLKYFSEQTLPRVMGGGNSRTPKASFAKHGVVTLNKDACQLMEVKAGDKITVAQDEEDPENFYFFKDPEHGFLLRTDGKTSCLFSHKAMIELIRDAKDLPTDKNIKALIAGKPTTIKGDKAGTKYWGILIRPSV